MLIYFVFYDIMTSMIIEMFWRKMNTSS